MILTSQLPTAVTNTAYEKLTTAQASVPPADGEVQAVIRSDAPIAPVEPATETKATGSEPPENAKGTEAAGGGESEQNMMLKQLLEMIERLKEQITEMQARVSEANTKVSGPDDTEGLALAEMLNGQLSTLHGQLTDAYGQYLEALKNAGEGGGSLVDTSA